VNVKHGDARELVHALTPGSVQLVCTSPPYFGQRRYGDDPEHEIGWGTLDTYLADCRTVLDGLKVALDDDGTVWWVVGDKAAGSGGAGGDHLKGGSKDWIPTYGKVDAGLPSGQWCMVPYRFAQMAQADGWLVRSIIVWDKTPTTRPEDPKHANRPLVSTERIVLLAKKVRHRWHPVRLIEPADVWHIAPKRESKAKRHYAPYPGEIPRRAILAASSVGDLVLDPFAGSGTTLLVASDLRREALGFELYPS
jgi:DNA modification methylase